MSTVLERRIARLEEQLEALGARFAPAAPAPGADWHPEDIKAAVRRQGWSLRQLSLSRGLGENTLRHALRTPYPAYERVIAEVIGVPPEQIWPSRYQRAGRALRPKTHPTPAEA